VHTRLFRIAALLIFAFGIAQGQSRHIHFDYVRADTLRSDSLALDKLNMLGYILPWGAQVIPTTVDTTWWGAKQNVISNLADTTKYIENGQATASLGVLTLTAPMSATADSWVLFTESTDSLNAAYDGIAVSAKANATNSNAGSRNIGLFASASGSSGQNLAGYFGSGNVRIDNQLIMPIATGTSPFSITSTTLNTNLNADLLDGYHASGFSLSGHTHSAADITSGTLGIARGGTNASTFTASQLLQMNSAGTALESSGKTAADIHSVYFGTSWSNGTAYTPLTVDGVTKNYLTAVSYVSNSDMVDSLHASAFATAGHSHYLEGSGAPAADLGVNGDIYYNSDGPTLYIKGGASWFQVYP